VREFGTMAGAVVWAESSDDEQGDEPETEAHGEVDETFASRRLRRWLKGMFGGPPEPDRPPADTDPDS
jgi:hypothetical protein